MKTRTLKIETAGDFWRGKVSPKIRLTGRWLERAGFAPGHRVTVEISQPGTLTLRFLNQTDVNGQRNDSPFQHSATLPMFGDLL
jgi:hypothetical protein